MRPQRLCRRLSRKGFTLIEVLVAVGLTALMMWGLVQLYSSATRFSSAMFTEAELCAGGRAVLDLLCHELSSAATRDIGYMKISDGGTSIQFVAPVGESTELAHVKYHLQGNTLCRAVQTPVQSGDDQSTDPGTGNALGVSVQSFTIQYIDATGTGEPVRGDHTWGKDTNPSDGIDPLPRAILIEVRLVDPRGRAAITLSSGAYLGGSGV